MLTSIALHSVSVQTGTGMLETTRPDSTNIFIHLFAEQIFGCAAFLFFLSLIVVLVLTPLAKKCAWKVGAVDFPGKRRVNQVPIPRMGGSAIFCARVCTLALHAA